MRYSLQNAVLTATAITVLFWLDRLYDSALRDPRFFDGWILFAGMSVQLLFHFRKKRPMLPLGRASMWLKFHIYVGYFVIASFLLHTDFSWPDSLFEWALWSLFTLVALSGVAGAYLSWSVPAKMEHYSGQITFETIPAIRFKLAKTARDMAVISVTDAGSIAISDLYVNTLRGFFARPRNLLAHLRGSQRPEQQICDELDAVERFVDDAGKKTVHAIKKLAVAKNKLDFQFAHQGLLQIWLFVHVPATYCLIMTTLLHIAVMYAYTSGVP